MNLKEKFKASILGMALADSLAYESIGGKGYSSETQLAICVIKALCSCNALTKNFEVALKENFIDWTDKVKDATLRKESNETNLNSFEAIKLSVPMEEIQSLTPDAGATARSLPIGLYWSDIITKSIQFGILNCEFSHSDMNSKCSSVATALGNLLSVKNVPTGCWANEITVITSGIDKEFVESIKQASEIAAKKTGPKEAKIALGSGKQCNESVAIALYSCMSEPFSFDQAIAKAIETSDNPCSSASIVGGWMGAKFGLQALVGKIDSLESKTELEILSDQLYEAYVFRKKNINDYQLIFD